ncbi:MAG: CdaR family protein [Lachnospiraceae bacterium]|nr:CdaR family protein [Lachnospiraceae bacterium]
MRKKLTNNLFLKILSVIFAFFLWMVVVNIDDPDVTEIITGIPITIINEEKITEQGQVYYIEFPINQSGSVMVKGARSIVDKLKPSDIKATVDFSDVSSVGAVTINYTLPEGVQLVTKRVEMMRIVTETLKSDTFEVSIVTKGSTADGYLVGDHKVSPNRVKITAPESILNLIKKVVVEVDVDGMSTDISTQSKLRLYDGNGKEINYAENSDITISATTLNVSINMLRTQVKNLELELTGEVQDGYRFLGMNCDVTQIAVKGLPSKVTAFSTISVPASSGELDLSALTEKTEIMIDINRYLPEGISLRDESDRYVKVVLDVQPLYQRDLHLAMNEIRMENVPDNMDLTYNTEATTLVRLEGLYDDVNAILTDEMNPRVDLSNLGAGIHRLTVSLDVPDGVEHLNSTDIYVTLTEHVEETSEETSEESEGLEEAFQNGDASQAESTSAEEENITSLPEESAED